MFPFVHTLPTSCFLFSHWNILHSSPVLVQRASRQTTVTVKATAGNWSPGSKAPAHLAGKNIPGNFGFDPLSLGAPEGALSYYQQAELQHCRWAMMGVAGILIPDVLTHAGVLNVPDWTQAGKIYIEQVRHTVFFVALRSSRPSLLSPFAPSSHPVLCVSSGGSLLLCQSADGAAVLAQRTLLGTLNFVRAC